MEEEAEYAIIMWNFLQLFEITPERRYWVHPINRRRNISNLLIELCQYPEKFNNFCRMSVPTFDQLLNLVGERVEKKSTHCRRNLPPEERLLLTLIRFLAIGDRFQYLHYNFRVGATTAGRIISETCQILWDILSPIYLLNDPCPEKWMEIASRFEEVWNYRNCCGAIDGKHICIEQPWNCGSTFFNYKDYHSIVLQAVVDAEGNFLIVDVGEAGRNNDGGVFMASTFGRLFMDKKLNLPLPRPLNPGSNTLFPYVFVSDDAYALSKHMMKPFARLASLSRDGKIYNYRHSRARRIVECAFGMMVKKLRVLEHAMLVHPDTSRRITLACCALYNFIRKREGKMCEVYEELMELEESDDVLETGRVRASKAAYNVRDQFVHYFNSPTGSVPLQDHMVFHC